jgi:hypothetical protein
MKDKDDLKDLEKKIKALEEGKLKGEEATVLIDECVRDLAARGN